MKRESDGGEQSPSVWADSMLRNLLIGIAAGGVVATALAWLVGGWVPGIFVGLLVLGVWQGLYRGAAEIVGLALGLIVAMLIAPPLGKMCEGVFASVAGTRGLTNRMLSIVVVGLVITLVCWAVGAMLARRVVKRKPEWFTHNHYIGGGLGALEGVLLAVCVIWLPTAIRPVAAMRAAAEQDERNYDALIAGQYQPGQQGPKAERASLADWLLARADDVDESWVGTTVNLANPLSSSQILDVAEDYIAVLRDEEATTVLQASDVWREMLALPSVTQARSVVEADASLRQIFETDGITIASMRELLESDTVLRVMDETNIREELEPLAPRLIEAIRQAKSAIKPN